MSRYRRKIARKLLQVLRREFARKTVVLKIDVGFVKYWNDDLIGWKVNGVEGSDCVEEIGVEGNNCVRLEEIGVEESDCVRFEEIAMTQIY